MFLTDVFTEKADTSFSLSFCGKCVAANFAFLKDLNENNVAKMMNVSVCI